MPLCLNCPSAAAQTSGQDIRLWLYLDQTVVAKVCKQGVAGKAKYFQQNYRGLTKADK